MQKNLILLLISAIVLMTGCQNNEVENGQASEEAETNIFGDIQEKTVSIDDLPTFLNHHDDAIANIYEQVPHHQDVIQYMPCYCGCGDTIDHTSSYDCFVNEHHENGAITWDEHGAKCNVCLEIAYLSVELHNNGMELGEIRAIIDERYKEGYAEPTKTQLPPKL